jgi:hypothetical protein
MMVSRMNCLISSSRRRRSFVLGSSGRFRPAGVVGSWICIAMLSVVSLGPHCVLRPAEAGQGDQAGSMPAPDPKRLVAEFHQDFRGGKFDSKMLKLVGGDAREFVKAEEDGLHIRIPAGLDKPMPRGCRPPLPNPRRLRDHRLLCDCQGRQSHPGLRARGDPVGRDRYRHGRGGDH